MAQETLDRIRQAEKKAEALEQEGRREAQELLRREKAEASAREDTLTQEAAAKNRERIRAAEQEAEAVLRQMVSDLAVTPAGRKIDHLALGASGGLGEEITGQVTGDVLSEKLWDICAEQELSLRITLDYDTDALLFTVWQGLDRTQEQSVNAWAVFSDDFENVLSSEYRVDRGRVKGRSASWRRWRSRARTCGGSCTRFSPTPGIFTWAATRCIPMKKGMRISDGCAASCVP